MGDVILEIRKLCNFFGRVCTAGDLDLKIESGVLTSIIGPNGAGKSTLINLITGNLPVQSGTILFKNRDITHLPIHKRVRLGVCRSFQIVNIFPELTVFENIMIPILTMGGRSGRLFTRTIQEKSSRTQAEAVLEKVGLINRRYAVANALSHGDQRLLEVGVALAVNPALLFLDEPTAGMNPVERVRLLENIRQLSQHGRTTFVLVEHDMDIVFSLSERVIVLHRGLILGDGRPDEIKQNEQVREVYLGDAVEL
ncbi:MAG: ABC transporter ATP-binding protein [Desulfobacca sp.]|nr:ABC transporter ATP-binding protein [Desulfobacca sp.]